MIIGRGEILVSTILSREYPEWTQRHQVPLTELVPHPYLSERLQKCTVDIVLYREDQSIAVHVDDRHHTGAGTAKIDSTVDRLCRDYRSHVLRIREENCPSLFKNKDTKRALGELRSEILAWNLAEVLIAPWENLNVK